MTVDGRELLTGCVKKVLWVLLLASLMNSSIFLAMFKLPIPCSSSLSSQLQGLVLQATS